MRLSNASRSHLPAKSDSEDPEFKSTFQMKNTPIGLSEDLCCSENPASPSIIKLECDESYDRGLPNVDDSASDSLADESNLLPPGFPFGKNGKPRIVPFAPQPSPQLVA